MKKRYLFFLLNIIFISSISFPQPAFAYIGPGTGLSAIGAFLALVAGVIVTILGFFWYPIKRILGKKKSQEPDQVNKLED